MSINSTVPTELLLPTSIHEKESPEWMKSLETNKKHNNKKNLQKNPSSHSRINKKVKTIQEFLTNEKRKALTQEIQDKSRKYKQTFNRVENLSKQIAGPMALVGAARASILKNDVVMDNFPQEALEAGRNLIAMNERISELVENGVPTLLVLELTRQVLDADIPKSKPIVLYSDDEEEEDIDEEEEVYIDEIGTVEEELIPEYSKNV